MRVGHSSLLSACRKMRIEQSLQVLVERRGDLLHGAFIFKRRWIAP
jgi:hypothetical protein